ncbi:unnamed protein product [Linum tenue]|uniref:Uncharacterized protein n=1 Tax=Linum tenue TaxID=586396 RepID=A0AAV0M549_9ROSI|nr:unnamed protein product [Linum tenue]
MAGQSHGESNQSHRRPDMAALRRLLPHPQVVPQRPFQPRRPRRQRPPRLRPLLLRLLHPRRRRGGGELVKGEIDRRRSRPAVSKLRDRRLQHWV